MCVLRFVCVFLSSFFRLILSFTFVGGGLLEKEKEENNRRMVNAAAREEIRVSFCCHHLLLFFFFSSSHRVVPVLGNAQNVTGERMNDHRGRGGRDTS